jgi:hypothetical protein
VTPRVEFGGGATIVALRDACNHTAANADTWTGGVIIRGDAELTLSGGGIISNHCLRVSGNSGVITLENGASATYNQPGGYTVNPNRVISPEPVEGPDANIDTGSMQMRCPDLGVDPADNVQPPGNQPGTFIDPGNYGDIIIGNNRKLTLSPGRYCFHGNVDITGEIEGVGVTIFMPNTNKYFYVSGSAIVNLSAPAAPCAYCPDAIQGMLIWSNTVASHSSAPGLKCTNSKCDVNLLGNANTNYVGTVYAPNAKCRIGGTSGAVTTYGVQLICDTVNIHGTSETVLTYDSSMVVRDDARLNLEE